MGLKGNPTLNQELFFSFSPKVFQQKGYEEVYFFRMDKTFNTQKDINENLSIYIFIVFKLYEANLFTTHKVVYFSS